MTHILTMDTRIEAIPPVRYKNRAVCLGFPCHILQSPQKPGLLHHFCRKTCFSSSPRNKLFTRVSCKGVLLSSIQMAGPVNEIKKMLNKNIFILWTIGFVKIIISWFIFGNILRSFFEIYRLTVIKIVRHLQFWKHAPSYLNEVSNMNQIIGYYRVLFRIYLNKYWCP